MWLHHAVLLKLRKLYDKKVINSDVFFPSQIVIIKNLTNLLDEKHAKYIQSRFEKNDRG